MVAVRVQMAVVGRAGRAIWWDAVVEILAAVVAATSVAEVLLILVAGVVASAVEVATLEGAEEGRTSEDGEAIMAAAVGAAIACASSSICREGAAREPLVPSRTCHCSP